MADSSGDEADSRTAAVGFQRSRANNSSARNSQDGDSRPAKKQRRSRSRGQDVTDFLPRGASFSETPLRGSSSGSGHDSDGSDAPKSTAANPHVGSTAPAISWNQGKKAAVRTTLGKRKATPTNGTTNQFNAVNDTYWRARSASVSSGASDTQETTADKDKAEESSGLEEGEVDSKSESDGSVSSNSEADDSILLNIGAKNANDATPAEALLADGVHTNGVANGQTNGSAEGVDTSGPAEPKEDAFQRFSRKYPTAPIALMDLSQEDFEEQARYVHWALDINDIDLQLPVVCIECQGQGHLAEVCPTKECVHCGVWNKHTSPSCSTWQRCPRCRERGHDEAQCSSPLKGSTTEVPCDLCGSQNHVEVDCSAAWKSTLQEPTATGVTVSLSCARCISSSHLIGDCPSNRNPLPNSSFTLSGVDPSTITNLNTGPSTKPISAKPPPPTRAPRSKNRRGPKIRDPSSESDNGAFPPRGGRRPPPPPSSRGRGRGNISFGSSNTFVPSQPRGKPPSRPFNGNRGPPPPRGGGGGGFRGRGRGGKSRRGK
ncbi:uncharacterized protein N7443_008522 [Penicillium atrosanguineum]|uniref:uncharacterized protein n=1 Tax=Penicillium atrosanguineum TaxID=1132637 RepID=UPI00238A56C5|nr:uncharacterized protein N7443_008522 [Penicillium atrosanguineum]KAJ5292569.1 hypothetical protein N7443_008522 [Penicillium atrosanguineum]